MLTSHKRSKPETYSINYVLQRRAPDRVAKKTMLAQKTEEAPQTNFLNKQCDCK